MSAAFPKKIIVIEAAPTLRPITSEEARLIFEGNISWDNLIHMGRVDIVKKPVNMKNITGTIPGVLNIKKVKGTEKIKEGEGE